MPTTKEEIREWVISAKEENASYLIIVCDSFDYGDYSVAVFPGENLPERVAEFDDKNMQRIMEIYDLSEDIEEQLNSFRAGLNLLSICRAEIK